MPIRERAYGRHPPYSSNSHPTNWHAKDAGTHFPHDPWSASYPSYRTIHTAYDAPTRANTGNTPSTIHHSSDTSYPSNDCHENQTHPSTTIITTNHTLMMTTTTTTTTTTKPPAEKWIPTNTATYAKPSKRVIREIPLVSFFVRVCVCVCVCVFRIPLCL